jgi:hypothetical protein
LKTITPASHRRYWLFSADPHHYHWDTLFVKGKEMYRTPRARPDTQRMLKQTRRGDRVLCYHSAPERALYAIAEVARDPYPDPHDSEGKHVVIDLRAVERLSQSVATPRCAASNSSRMSAWRFRPSPKPSTRKCSAWPDSWPNQVSPCHSKNPSARHSESRSRSFGTGVRNLLLTTRFATVQPCGPSGWHHHIGVF